MQVQVLHYLSLIYFLVLSPFQSQALSFKAIETEGQQYLEIKLDEDFSNDSRIYINEMEREIVPDNGIVLYPIEVDRKGQLYVISSSRNSKKNLIHVSKKKNRFRLIRIPLWCSILPPLIAIALALFIKEVNLALFAGIWSGAFLLGGLRLDSIFYFFSSILETVSHYIIQALNNPGHLSVLVFSLMIGGMVAIISKNGGMAGIVNALSRYAKDRKSSQFITWLMGIAIFFDDYANSLIVGNTMRPVTDKFKISREKLAYIVDSTAAPVSAIAFITTWIGAELGYIEKGILALDNFDNGMSAYAIFIQSLKYSFYPILALIFILLLVRSGKDFGPMHKAETRALSTGQVSPAATDEADEPNMEDLNPVPGSPNIWWHAALPVITVVLVTILGLVSTGFQSTFAQLTESGYEVSETWGDIWKNMNLILGEDHGVFMKFGTLIGNADSYIALLWASLSGLLVAIVITIGSRTIKLFDTMHYMVTGFKTMLPALLILSLAWALADITDLLHTADFITALLGEHVSAYFLPSIIFVLAAVIAFSTGSSWSTMAILYPLAIPASWTLSVQQGLDPDTSMEILYNCIATVLAASVLGDHCSPISDTTILSSLASNCNHIDHVNTQLPYAILVGIVSLLGITVSTFLGGGWLVSLLCILISIVILYLAIEILGKKPMHANVE